MLSVGRGTLKLNFEGNQSKVELLLLLIIIPIVHSFERNETQQQQQQQKCFKLVFIVLTSKHFIRKNRFVRQKEDKKSKQTFLS